MAESSFVPNATVQVMPDSEMRDRFRKMDEVRTIAQRSRNEIIEVGADSVVVKSDNPRGKDKNGVNRPIKFKDIRSVGPDPDASPPNGCVKQALHHALALDLKGTS